MCDISAWSVIIDWATFGLLCARWWRRVVEKCGNPPVRCNKCNRLAPESIVLECDACGLLAYEIRRRKTLLIVVIIRFRQYVAGWRQQMKLKTVGVSTTRWNWNETVSKLFRNCFCFSFISLCVQFKMKIPQRHCGEKNVMYRFESSRNVVSKYHRAFLCSFTVRMFSTLCAFFPWQLRTAVWQLQT